MSIKSQGGVFGRNPTFNDVTVDGDLSIAGTLSVGGETITGLSYQGGWNASTNTPDIAASSPVTGQFWIVSADGSTNVGGITNWTQGDWALYDGSNWQRVEGGNTDLSTGVQGQLAVANGGTGAADAATARTNLGLGTAATTAATDYATAAQGALADSALQSSDIGVSVQGYDATILTSSDIGSTVQGYDAGTLTSADIGSTVQGYDADTAKYDAATAAFTGNLSVDSTTLYVDASTNRIGVGTNTPANLIDAISDNSSGLDFICLDNTSTASNTTKFSGIKFRGKDTVGTGKDAVYIRTYPEDGNHVNSALSIYTRNSDSVSEKVRITSVGNLKFTNSGNGIDFSATSGTGTSELLDDYEEGTWTPTLKGSGSDPTGAAVGYYTKIGNTVHLEGKFTFSTAGSGNYYVQHTTFPYSSSASRVTGTFNLLDVGVAWYQGICSGDGANMGFTVLGPTTFTNTTPFSIAAGDQLTFYITYRTS